MLLGARVYSECATTTTTTTTHHALGPTQSTAHRRQRPRQPSTEENLVQKPIVHHANQIWSHQHGVLFPHQEAQDLGASPKRIDDGRRDAAEVRDGRPAVTAHSPAPLRRCCTRPRLGTRMLSFPMRLCERTEDEHVLVGSGCRLIFLLSRRDTRNGEHDWLGFGNPSLDRADAASAFSPRRWCLQLGEAWLKGAAVITSLSGPAC